MSQVLPTSLQRMYDHLAAVAMPVAQRYAQVAPEMQTACTAPEFAQWEQHCLRLVRCGWRTWESAETFLSLSPFLQHHLGASDVCTWAEQGLALARRSADVATAFFQAAKPLLRQASQAVFTAWVGGGQWHLKQYPTRPHLAAEYFRVSPQVYGQYPLPACDCWVQLGQAFARVEAQHLQTFFRLSQEQLERLSDVDLAPAWDMAARLMPSTPNVALHYLERYVDFIQYLGPEALEQVHAVMRALQASGSAVVDAFLHQVGGTLRFVPATERTQILAWCQQIAAVQPASGLDFLSHLSELSRRLSGPRLSAWIRTGIEVAQRHAKAGQAYFALESVTAHERLRALQKRVGFADVERVLRLYTEALLGRRIELTSAAGLPTQLHTAGRELPTTDGTTIFVPEHMDDFATAQDNFAVYKVAILHQVGFYECGTFTFAIEACRRRMPESIRQLAALADPLPVELSAAFEHFFAWFPQADLARRLFTILEDARIDAYLARRYKGIRPDLVRVMQHSLHQRPALEGLPLRQVLLEILLQMTLGGQLHEVVSPANALYPLLQRLCRYLHPLQASGATVYDTAVAVGQCYLLLIQIPERAAATFSAAAVAHIEALAAALPDDAEMIDLADLFRQAGEGADGLPVLPGTAEPAKGVEPVPYRGEVKPELIQKQLRVQELTEALEPLQDAVSPLSAEFLKKLLEQGELDIQSVQEGELDATSGLWVSDLEDRDGVGQRDRQHRAELQRQIDALRAEVDDAYGALSAQSQAVLYDEWDYGIGDYRKHWCRLTETLLEQEDTAFVEKTRQQYAELLAQVSRQFQMLKPQRLKKINRLVDGEDIDLDRTIEAIVDRRSGNVLSDNVYMRRHKRERCVAALFLLDMSASTDDEIKEPAVPDAARSLAVKPPLRQYDFSGFILDDDYTPPQEESSKRRIIDVEKEALVLMAEAIEGLGDAYAVYGFSGYGRDQVDFYVAKEFADPYDARVQGRISAIKPHRSTRMGPAIRHAIHKLERQEARIKTLLLLSDGYPQDYDYGKDRKSRDYGIQDTMMALHEARLKGIQTFCITVDPAGNDYLRDMCPDHNYLVLDDITALPNELPKIYRGLTT
ncbi:hypothetical protein NKDENANG_00979 [Candidatus Entotheonellaceae bacterium PAL068K]